MLLLIRTVVPHEPAEMTQEEAGTERTREIGVRESGGGLSALGLALRTRGRF